MSDKVGLLHLESAMRATTIDVRKIYYMRKTSDYYHIKFDECMYFDEMIHPAGEIICKAVTQEDEKRYLRDYGSLAEDALMTDTITRYGTLFWDKGAYTPEAPNADTNS